MLRHCNSEQQYHSSGDLSGLRYDIDELSRKLEAIRSQISGSEVFPKSHSKAVSHDDTAYCSPPPLPPRTYRVTSLLRNAPPKPRRTFDQSLRNLAHIPRPLNLCREKTNVSIQDKWTCSVPISASDNLSAKITSNFKKNICWFELEEAKEFVFVNPYNDLYDSKCRRYDVIQQLQSDISESRAIMFCGDTDSGKSYLAEMLVTDLATKFSGISTAISSALLITNALTNVRNASRYFSSISANEYQMVIKDGCLSNIKIGILMTELSPIVRGEIKLAEIISKGLTCAEDRERYFLDPLSPENSSSDMCRQMRDIQLAFSVLSISASDVLRVLVACLLLRKVTLSETTHSIDTENIKEIERAAILLGISPIELYLAIVRPHGSNSTQPTIEMAQQQLFKLVKALYHRCVNTVIRRINTVLQHYCSAQTNSSIVSDGESSTNDSGVGLSSKELTYTVIDCFGTTKAFSNFSSLLRNMGAESLSRLRDSGKNRYNDCFFSNLDHICDIMCQNSESTPENCVFQTNHGAISFASAAKNIDGKTRLMDVRNTSLVVKHLGRSRPMIYDTTDFSLANQNTLCSRAVHLFKPANCTFPFVCHLFANDFQKIESEEDIGVRVCELNCPTGNEAPRHKYPDSFVHGFRTGIDGMLSRTNVPLHIVHCLSSNRNREYSHLCPDHFKTQLDILSNATCAKTVESPPNVPFDRNYSVYDNKKHCFPQRRVVIADYHDSSADCTFRADDVIRISGFGNDTHTYTVDVNETKKSTIPTQFTRLSEQFPKCFAGETSK